MIDPEEGRLKNFDVSPICGFLPEEPPSQKLSDQAYKPWEDLVNNLPCLLREGKLKAEVEKLPVLDCSLLKSIQERRRAYVILAFLAHGYIWCGQEPSGHLPPQITVPLLQASNHLGLPPIATYAALNMWNFTFDAASRNLSRPEDFKILFTFTGTKSEEWFYAISDALEAGGGPVILNMLRCNEAAKAKNSSVVTSYLKTMASDYEDLGRLLKRMNEHCDPDTFYYQIRPFLAGSKGIAKAGSPKGVFYDEGDGKGSWREYSGASNAQSSTIQFLDIILGVQHYATGELRNGIASSHDSSPPKNGFLKEMRSYMPSSHRDFLERMSSSTCIRQFVLDSIEDLELRAAYDDAVLALAAFRDIHLQIVARYIINPSRNPPKNKGIRRNGCKLASQSSSEPHNIETTEPEKSGLKGSGGTDLMMFLKQTRDETRRAAVDCVER